MEGWWQISWQKPCRKEDTGSNIFKAMKEENIANLEPCSLQKGRLLHGHYFCLNGQLSQLSFREISIIRIVYYLNIWTFPVFFHLLLQFLLPQLSARIPPPLWAFPKASPPPEALYTPLFSLLSLHVRSTSETVFFSDNLFTSPDFLFITAYAPVPTAVPGTELVFNNC